MKNQSGNDIQVCAIFFLKTLGYTSGKVIVNLFGSVEYPPTSTVTPPDRRGKGPKANKRQK